MDPRTRKREKDRFMAHAVMLPIKDFDPDVGRVRRGREEKLKAIIENVERHHRTVKNNIITTTVETSITKTPDPPIVPPVVPKDPRLRHLQQPPPQPTTQQQAPNLTTQQKQQQQQHPSDPLIFKPAIETLTKRLREPQNPETYAEMMLKPKDHCRADLLSTLLTTNPNAPCPTLPGASTPAPVASALAKLHRTEAYDRHAAEGKSYFVNKTAGYASMQAATSPVTIGGAGHGGGYFGNSGRSGGGGSLAASPMERVERTASLSSVGAAPVAPMAPSMVGASGGDSRRSSAGEGSGLGSSALPGASRDPRRMNVDASRDPRRR